MYNWFTTTFSFGSYHSSCIIKTKTTRIHNLQRINCFTATFSFGSHIDNCTHKKTTFGDFTRLHTDFLFIYFTFPPFLGTQIIKCTAQGKVTQPKKQCSGSESGSTCFWASWIRIRIHQSEVWIRIRIRTFCHHAKIVRKTLIRTILWLFLTFYLWKIM